MEGILKEAWMGYTRKHGRDMKGSMEGILKEAWKGYERKHGRNMQGSMYGNILLCSFSPFDVKNGVKGV